MILCQKKRALYDRLYTKIILYRNDILVENDLNMCLCVFLPFIFDVLPPNCVH